MLGTMLILQGTKNRLGKTIAEGNLNVIFYFYVKIFDFCHMFLSFYPSKLESFICLKDFYRKIVFKDVS